MSTSSEPSGYEADENAQFPSKEYLKRFTDPETDPMKVHVKFLQAYHDFYDKYCSNGQGAGGSDTRSLLEFGGGPTLHSVISGTRHVGSITFADYAESNRAEIITWKDNAEGAHDWTQYIKYVVAQLEGSGSTDDSSVVERTQDIRSRIQHVVSCNIRSENFIDATSHFDFIHTNLCLEIACETKSEFNKCISKLGTLLVPGGYLVCLTAKGGAWYTCAGAGKKLFQLKMEVEDILTAIEESDLELVESYNIQPEVNPLSATRSFQFTIARKKQ